MSGTPSSTSELLNSVSRSLNTPVPPHDSQAQLRVRVFRAKDIPLRQDQTPPIAYAVIEYGKEKYKTGVVSSSSPEWREECIFSLKPGYMNVLVHVFDKEDDTSRPLGYVALQLVDIKLAAQSQRQWSVLTPGKYSKTKPSSIAIDAPKANTIKISVEACFIGETLPLWLQNGANRASTQRRITANDKRISGDSAYISDSARTSTITNTTATSPDRLEMPMITLESYNTPNSARSSMDNVSMEAYSNPATPKQARRFISRQMVRSKLANSAATDTSSIGDLSSLESVIPRVLSGNSLSLLSLRDNPSITHIAPTCGLANEETAISVFGMRLGESLDDIETINLMGINVSDSTTWHNSSHVSFKAPPVEHLLLDTILKDNMNTLKHVRYIKFEVPVIIISKQYGLSNENVCFTYEMNLSRILSPQNSEVKVSRIQRSDTAPRFKQNSLTVRSNEDVSLSSPNISHAKRSPLSFQHVPASSEQSIASDAGEVDSKASLSDDNEAQLYKKLLLEKQQELTSLKLYLDKVLAKVIETDPNMLEQISRK
jgi:hypothetical protein